MGLITVEQGERIRGRKEDQQGSAYVVDSGEDLWLKVVFVNPGTELLTFSLAMRSDMVHHARQSKEPSA